MGGWGSKTNASDTANFDDQVSYEYEIGISIVTKIINLTWTQGILIWNKNNGAKI